MANFMDRFVNFLAVLFVLIEGQYMHGKGRISRYFPGFADFVEFKICDACEEYSLGTVFSEDPLPLHWYFLPRGVVERKLR